MMAARFGLTHCNTMRHTATHFYPMTLTRLGFTKKPNATHCNTFLTDDGDEVWRNTVQHTATTLQHTATHFYPMTATRFGLSASFLAAVNDFRGWTCERESVKESTCARERQRGRA